MVNINDDDYRRLLFLAGCQQKLDNLSSMIPSHSPVEADFSVVSSQGNNDGNDNDNKEIAILQNRIHHLEDTVRDLSAQVETLQNLVLTVFEERGYTRSLQPVKAFSLAGKSIVINKDYSNRSYHQNVQPMQPAQNSNAQTTQVHHPPANGGRNDTSSSRGAEVSNGDTNKKTSNVGRNGTKPKDKKASAQTKLITVVETTSNQPSRLDDDKKPVATSQKPADDPNKSVN